MLGAQAWRGIEAGLAGAGWRWVGGQRAIHSSPVAAGRRGGVGDAGMALAGGRTPMYRQSGGRCCRRRRAASRPEPCPNSNTSRAASRSAAASSASVAGPPYTDSLSRTWSCAAPAHPDASCQFPPLLEQAACLPHADSDLRIPQDLAAARAAANESPTALPYASPLCPFSKKCLPQSGSLWTIAGRIRSTSVSVLRDGQYRRPLDAPAAKNYHTSRIEKARSHSGYLSQSCLV